MSFFNYPIYQVADDHQKEAITLSEGINIIVRADAYDEAAQTLLGKILKSVGQQLEAASLHRVTEGSEVHFSSLTASSDILVLVLGLSPNECSLQLDKRQYVLFRLSSKTLLFSKSLTELPDDAEGRRALWTTLKEYYNL